MAKIRNVGRDPDTDNALGVKNYTDSRFAQNAVVAADVTNALSTRTTGLSLKTYVDQQDALYVAKTYVDTQDGLLTAATQLGATSGLAKLDATGKTSAPTPLVNRAKAKSYHFTYSIVRTTNGGLWIMDMTIPDPGYPWIGIWTGWTQGRWDSGGWAWPGVSVRHSDGHWAARGFSGMSRAVTDGERIPLNLVTTTDKTQGTAYTGAQTFGLWYSREWVDPGNTTGVVAVGETSSWFNCLVLPAATTMAPTAIT